MTGIMDGAVRVSGIYRNQWSSITNPYETPGAQVEVATTRNLNFGANIMNQQAGDGGFRYFQTSLTLNYTGIRWGSNQNHHLNVALQAGMIQRSLDPSKLRLGDQWVPGFGYDPDLVSNDYIRGGSTQVADIGAGFFYYNDSEEKRVLPFIGFAAYHLNQPLDPFFTEATPRNMAIRYVAQAGFAIHISETTSLTPHMLYMYQGTAMNLIAGGQLKQQVNDNTQFMLGAYYRLRDAVIPFAAIGIGRSTIGLSYDVTNSSLAQRVNGTGSLELSFSHVFNKRQPGISPHFECPRL